MIRHALSLLAAFAGVLTLYLVARGVQLVLADSVPAGLAALTTFSLAADVATVLAVALVGLALYDTRR